MTLGMHQKPNRFFQTEVAGAAKKTAPLAEDIRSSLMHGIAETIGRLVAHRKVVPAKEAKECMQKLNELLNPLGGKTSFKAELKETYHIAVCFTGDTCRHLKITSPDGEFISYYWTPYASHSLVRGKDGNSSQHTYVQGGVPSTAAFRSIEKIEGDVKLFLGE